MKKNPTRSRDLARDLQQSTGQGYQRCLAKVHAAREAGLLPSVADEDGYARALEILTSLLDAPATTAETELPAELVSVTAAGAPGPEWGSAPAGAEYPGDGIGTSSRKGFVIVVAAPKGGVGKSTLSTNLAAYMGHRLQQMNKNVVLLDTNIQNPAVGQMLGQYRPTVVDVARHANQLTPQVIQQSMVSRRDLNLDALLGPESPEKAHPTYVNGRLYREITAELKRSYDYIVVDTSVADMYHEVFQNFVLKEMDYMVMVTIPNYQTLLNVDQFLRVITADSPAGGFGIDAQRIGVVLNQAQDGVGADERDVKEELAAWRYLGRTPDSANWLESVNNHELVATKNYPEIHRAFDSILYQITGEPVFAPARPAGGKGG